MRRCIERRGAEARSRTQRKRLRLPRMRGFLESARASAIQDGGLDHRTIPRGLSPTAFEAAQPIKPPASRGVSDFGLLGFARSRGVGHRFLCQPAKPTVSAHRYSSRLPKPAMTSGVQRLSRNRAADVMRWGLVEQAVWPACGADALVRMRPPGRQTLLPARNTEVPGAKDVPARDRLLLISTLVL